MGTAQVQGRLWGMRARDYAQFAEGAFRPLFEAVLTATEVGSSTRFLDVGCGTGLAAELAARRGAAVCGLDAAEQSLAIARERTPGGDFRLGEMETLPWPDDSFDVVTGFNAFQFAADKVNGLREARRVATPSGRVAMAVWGRQEDCGMAVTFAAISKRLPPPTPDVGAPFALGQPGWVERLLEEAGLLPVTSGEVDCDFVFPDLDTASRAVLSSGMAVSAAEQIGEEPVRQAIAESFAHFRTPSGGYHQPNRMRYVIASAG